MSSLFSSLRKVVKTTYLIGDVEQEFTLLQPSAHARNLYLLECEKCAEDATIKAQVDSVKQKGEVDTSLVSFKSVAENEKMSMYLIALCLYESLEHKPTLEECWQDLLNNVDSDFIDHFYEKANALTWPPAPKDALDPKADQGKGLATD